MEVPEGSEIGQAIMEGRCLDVIEIDGASNNSVEQVKFKGRIPVRTL